MSLSKDKICENSFVRLDDFLIDDKRGIIFAGPQKMMSLSEYCHTDKYGDYAIFVDGKLKPHLHGDFSLIGGKIVWEDRSDGNYSVCREDGLRVPGWGYGPYTDLDSKLVCVCREGKSERPLRLWVDGEIGPLCNYIFDIVQTSKGIGYTGFFDDTYHCMLNNKKFEDHSCSHKMFEHDGKLGCVVIGLNNGKRAERVYYDGKPCGEPGQEVWYVGSVNGRLVQSIQSGSVFQSGNIKGGKLDGWPMYDLTSDFGYHLFIDKKYIASGQSIHFIPVGNKLGINIKHSTKLQDPDEWTELLVVDRSDSIDRFKFKGTGYINDIGGKIAFNQWFGNEQNVYLEDRLVLDGVRHSEGYHGLVDVGGKVGMILMPEEKGLIYPSIDGKISGEGIPYEGHYFDDPCGVFDGNLVIANRYDAYVKCISVQGKTYGPLEAVSKPLFKDGKLYFVVSGEKGTYLWTFTEDKK